MTSKIYLISFLSFVCVICGEFIISPFRVCVCVFTNLFNFSSKTAKIFFNFCTHASAYMSKQVNYSQVVYKKMLANTVNRHTCTHICSSTEQFIFLLSTFLLFEMVHKNSHTKRNFRLKSNRVNSFFCVRPQYLLIKNTDYFYLCVSAYIYVSVYFFLSH